jgi:hypothetical protein
MQPLRLPPSAAWRHQGARTGFEVVHFRSTADGFQIDGMTTAVENGQAWSVGYSLVVDGAWLTRTARVTGWSSAGQRTVRLESDGAGSWRVNGEQAPHLDGCRDVDLESSAMTNALPVRRLDLPLGARASTPAAYVRAVDLSVDRLEQEYLRMDDTSSGQRYAYAAPAFDFSCRLVYDESGLVLDYPGIAERAA